jgi:hypothetical protein
MVICQPSAIVFRSHGLIKPVCANCATTGRPSSSWRRLPRVWHACMPLLRHHERLQAAGTLHKTHGRGGHTRKSHRALHPANEKEPLQTNGQPCGHQDKASNRIYYGSAPQKDVGGGTCVWDKPQRHCGSKKRPSHCEVGIDMRITPACIDRSTSSLP